MWKCIFSQRPTVQEKDLKTSWSWSFGHVVMVAVAPLRADNLGSFGTANISLAISQPTSHAILLPNVNRGDSRGGSQCCTIHQLLPILRDEKNENALSSCVELTIWLARRYCTRLQRRSAYSIGSNLLFHTLGIQYFFFPDLRGLIYTQSSKQIRQQ